MNALGAECKPRLARGVRLRLDRITGRTLLLRPEQGFELRGSAGEVARLCTAELTLAQIVDRLAETHPDATREQIAADVGRLLSQLADRGLIVVSGS